MKKSESGFTLIEVLIVVAILGILSGIAVISVASLSHSASIRACETDWRSVSNAANAYINDNPKTALTKFDLYKKNSDGTSNDLTNTLPGLGYMSSFNQPNGYKIKLTWATTQTSLNNVSTQSPVISVFNAAGTLQYGTTNSVTDCSIIP